MDQQIDPCPAIGLQQLLALPQHELFELWKSLPAPGMGELDGEYSAYMPILHISPEEIRDAATQFYRDESARGYWLGKAYKANGDSTGEGYNIFRKLGEDGDGYRYTRKGRFATDIGESFVDGRPSLMMWYRAFNKQVAGITDLVDEVRHYAKGLYLATATAPSQDDGTRTMPDSCFLLAGPVNPWVGPDDAEAGQR
ncbi:hypothetical protein [Saccharopolyspora shandongensis]|uniref:hypothetical protein n=1 Tax=Saccharopolyspora shandongensis TaxID=418495 RepID=UPI0033F4B91D